MIRIQIDFSSNLNLTITDDVLARIKCYEQGEFQHESGGMLLGKKEKGQNKYIICDISTPSEYDKSGFMFFIRDMNSSQLILNEVWELSKGEINYLGEWHTHGFSSATPSMTDKRLIKQICEDGTPPFNHYFMIILGRGRIMSISAMDVADGGKITYHKHIQGV